MAGSIGDAVPAGLRPVLDGSDPERWEGFTVSLLTVTADGWPHVALLSVGELLWIDPQHLRLALWPNSTATANLGQAGRATLALVHDNAAYYLRCRAQRLANLPADETGSRLACFELTVADVLQDVVGYATLTSGITFRLTDRQRHVARWRATHARLRAAAPAPASA
jgi:hypothetical protein